MAGNEEAVPPSNSLENATKKWLEVHDDGASGSHTKRPVCAKVSRAANISRAVLEARLAAQRKELLLRELEQLVRLCLVKP